MVILGISCFYHDAAACLMKDGEILAAAQEERFTRKKHDSGFPARAIEFCLNQAGIQASDLDYVAFYDKPFLKIERILLTYFATFPRSYRSFLKAIPLWLKQKLWIRKLIEDELDYTGEILFSEHHLSHAASSFFVSPFEEAAIITIDGVGEWATAALAHGKGNEIKILKEIHFPHSLGLLYSAFTYYLGFRVNSAEYKVMGLAPYGRPIYTDIIKKELIDIKDDGSFRMNMDYFSYDYGLTMTNRRFSRLFGAPPRKPESGELTQKHMDLAASVQKVTEEIVLKMASCLHEQTGLKKLCMAGGVALNCVANGRVLKEGPFEDIFIQPAAGDAGGAVGAATLVYHSLAGGSRNGSWKHAFLGPVYSEEAIRLYLKENDIPYEELPRDVLLRESAQLLADQKVIGWFQGRMEFGPRALGGRSILADARNPENKDIVNAKIKFRESFRPFAPTAILEHAEEYFDLNRPSPYMLFTAPAKGGRLPAVTHVDGSARIQTVTREENEMYHDLIQEFYRLTGCPVILNTSFNLRGEPIVNTPREAYLCFMRSGLDYLVMGNFLLDKRRMKPLPQELAAAAPIELD